jgi:choline kinase
MAGKLQVIIPTSGLGSRLGELTEYTNKALVRVGTKAVISHIIDSYPQGTVFLVMLGHKGELVRQYLSLAHPDLEVYYLDRELKSGENMGLVGALCAHREALAVSVNDPIIFHASDTIVDLPREFLENAGNQVLGVPVGNLQDIHDYRTLRPVGGHVALVQEKGDLATADDYIHVGVVRFEDGIAFYDALAHCQPYDCDTHILAQTVRAGGDKFKVLAASNWFDTGNMSKLAVARKHYEVEDFVLLEKPDQAVYMVGDRVIKFFANPEMVDRRVTRAAYLKGAVPEILGSYHNFFAYRKAPGRLARDVMQPSRFAHFLDWALDTIWSTPFQGSYFQFPGLANEFYRLKTADRIAKFYTKTGLADERDYVNERSLPPLVEMLGEVNWDKLGTDGGMTSGMHGDLHFSNILVSPYGVGSQTTMYTLLDWRESFAGSVTTGDVYYDLGKLLHGLIVSHDMVERNQFKIQIADGQPRRVTIDIMRSQRLVECEHVLEEWCTANNWEWPRVRLMCALIYLNIAALHHHPYDQFLYFLGKSMLYEELSK